MKIEKEYLEDHQVKLKVEIEPEAMEAAKRRAARQIARRVKIPGFRPGKAPFAVVERTVGEAAILEDGLEILIKDLYPKIIEEAEIQPYGPGRLENLVSIDPPILEILVPLDAEVKLGDYRAIRLPYELKEIGEEDIDRVIQYLKKHQAVLEPVDRPIQVGDQVYLRLSASRKNAAEDQATSLIQERPYPVIVESEPSDPNSEWPFLGFSLQLVGLSKGDQKVIHYQYPDDSIYEALRGVEADFSLTIEDVKSRQLPDLTDEFAQSMGEYETVDALRSAIRTNLETKAKNEYDHKYNNQIVEAVLADASIKYPPQMLENEIEEFIHQLEHRLAQQNLDMETYLKTRSMDAEALRAEIAPSAETRLKRSLVLFELAKLENIEVESEDVQSETIRTLNELDGVMSVADARKINKEGLVQNIMSSVTADLLVKNTLARLQALAKDQLETG